MKIKKILAVSLISTVLFSPIAALADTNTDTVVIADSAYQYLLSKGIASEKLDQLDLDILESTMRQAEANNFTNEQIQQYIDGQISIANTITPHSNTENGVISEDGSTITTSYGTVSNLLSRYTEQLTDENAENGITTAAYSSSPTTVVNSSDQTGVYWAVKSGTGYTEATSFITLPTISNYNSIDRPYLFLAANSTASGTCLTFIGDYGVVYNGGSWYPFVNASQWSDSLGAYQSIASYWPSTKITTTSLYLHIKITNGSSTDTVYFEILDGNNFSNVIYSTTISFTGNPVNASASNLNLYHETTLAQVHSTGTSLNTSTGTLMTNAKFTNAYLYNSSTTSQWGTNQTSSAYRQAPTTTKLNCVTLNSYSMWHTDDVSIRFNQ